MRETRQSPAPAMLYVYRWRGRPCFLRLAGMDEARPPCPRLYDEVIEIPVVARGERPPVAGMRTVPLVADWLEDLVD